MTATFDTQHPFRFTLESGPDTDMAAAILMMDAPTSPLAIHVHGIDPGGNRTVSAHANDLTVLYRTVLTPKQYAEVLVQVDKYNADPKAGWETLRARLAAEYIGVLDDALATDMSPFALLRFESVDLDSSPPPASHVHLEKGHHGYVVRMPLAHGFTRLYAGPADPTEDVERFNRDPEAGFAKLWAAALTDRIAKRRLALEELAAEQVKDLRAIEQSLRLHRATGGEV